MFKFESKKDNPSYELLKTVRGIGLVTAAVLSCSVDTESDSKMVVVWRLGLAPSQYSSGEISIMGGITKRGNVQLRKLFIYGARAVMNYSKNKTDKFSLWLNNLFTRMHPCKAIVAIANKVARIAWTVLIQQEFYFSDKA